MKEKGLHPLLLLQEYCVQGPNQALEFTGEGDI